jgi:hypothetical protein
MDLHLMIGGIGDEIINKSNKFQTNTMMRIMYVQNPKNMIAMGLNSYGYWA